MFHSRCQGISFHPISQTAKCLFLQHRPVHMTYWQIAAYLFCVRNNYITAYLSHSCSWVIWRCVVPCLKRIVAHELKTCNASFGHFSVQSYFTIHLLLHTFHRIKLGLYYFLLRSYSFDTSITSETMNNSFKLFLS